MLHAFPLITALARLSQGPCMLHPWAGAIQHPPARPPSAAPTTLPLLLSPNVQILLLAAAVSFALALVEDNPEETGARAFIEPLVIVRC